MLTHRQHTQALAVAGGFVVVLGAVLGFVQPRARLAAFLFFVLGFFVLFMAFLDYQWEINEGHKYLDGAELLGYGYATKKKRRR